jgi:hypothetical protein
LFINSLAAEYRSPVFFFHRRRLTTAGVFIFLIIIEVASRYFSLLLKKQQSDRGEGGENQNPRNNLRNLGAELLLPACRQAGVSTVFRH